MNKIQLRAASILLAVILGIGGLLSIGSPVGHVAYAASDFAAGDGTAGAPYEIATAEQLNRVRDHSDKGYYFKLTADIDLSAYSTGAGWDPIAFHASKLDGNGFKISNLTINRPNESYVGLFLFPNSSSSLINLQLENVNVSGGYHVGSLAGANEGAISNSYAKGKVNGTASVGGLVGEFFGSKSGTISDSFSSVDVSGDRKVGGLVGEVSDTFEITNSYATGDVSGNENIGGLVGYWKVSSLFIPAKIENSYATGTVNGNENVGGLVGEIDSDEATIKNTFAIGSVTGSKHTGGLIGKMYNDSLVTNSFFDKDTTGQEDNGIGEGVATAQIADKFTALNWPGDWKINPLLNNGYPYLQGMLNFSVKYVGNGSTAGKAPGDFAAYGPNSPVEVKGNLGSLSRPGYTLAGWNTKANGTGQMMVAGESFDITADTILYAQWEISSEVELQNLLIDQGVITPSFSPHISEYTVEVGHAVTGVDLTVEKAIAEQTLSVTGAVYTTVTHDADTVTYRITGLNEGANKIEIGILAADGVTTGSYQLTIERAHPIPPPPARNSSSPGYGTITSSDGQMVLPAGWAGELSLGEAVSMSIPAFSTNQIMTLQINRLLDTAALRNNGEILAGAVFEFTKSVSDNFLKPVTITFAFDPFLLQPGQTAGIFYYDEVNLTWVALPEAIATDSHVAGETDHFTKFAVLVVDQATGLPVVEPEPSVVHYSDINGHWAEESILTAASKGIIQGYPDGSFRPDQGVTRAEFTVMLMKVLDAQGSETNFADVADIGSWARQAISQAVQAGIVHGYNDNTFQPNAKINREEMAVMLAQALDLPLDMAGATGFADDQDIPAWAKGAVAAMKKLGLVVGQGSNTFTPHAETTRAEAVTVLINLLAHKDK